MQPASLVLLQQLVPGVASASKGNAQAVSAMLPQPQLTRSCSPSPNACCALLPSLSITHSLPPPSSFLCRLIDQWAMTDHMHSVVIPPGACALFPSEFCTPELEELYGLETGINQTDIMMTVGVDGQGGSASTGGALAGEQEGEGGEGGCQLERWLVPGACILPTPVEVLIPLGQWERTSEKLVVNPRAKEAIRWERG